MPEKVEITLEDSTLWYRVPYRYRELIKKLPGAKYHAKREQWHTPLTWAALVQARGIFDDRLDTAVEVGEWAWNEYTSRVLAAETSREVALNPDSVGILGDPRMRNYQRTGVDFLVTAQSAVLADDRGLGKTFIALQTVEQLDAFPILVVSPKTAKVTSWADEIEKWYPGRSFTVVDSTGSRKLKQLSADTDITVVNFETLLTGRIARYGSIRLSDKDREDGPLNRDWGTIVVDEGHRVKDPHAKQTRALWAVGERAKHRYVLTGTPIANNLSDFWSILRFISPDEWPSKTAFVDRYCEVTFGYNGSMVISGLKKDNKEEFFRIVDCRLLRRTKELVAPDLPPKVHQVLFVDMTPKQKAAYNEMKKTQVAQLESGEIVASFNPMTLKMRLGRFAKAYCAVDDNGKIVMSMPSSTVDAVVELANETTPLVVFSAAKQLLNLADTELQAKGFTTARITGDESDKQRKDSLLRFNTNKAQVILCTLGAGSESIDLSHASVLVFMMRNYSAVANPQAEDRIHRLSQTADHVVIIDIITPGTVDEEIVPKLEAKYEIAEDLLRDKETLERYAPDK